MRSLRIRKPTKDQRERLVLMGLIDLYLETGKAVSSSSLRENGFESLSPATIRNYFSKLEAEGLLKQQHSSGGRIPTPLAYELYAEAHLKSPQIESKEVEQWKKSLTKQTKEVTSYLQYAAEALSEKSRCAVFLSSPRFDQDFVLDVKLVMIDSHRCLCLLITDFGAVYTEVLYTEKKLTHFILKKLEAFFHWKLTSFDQPSLSSEEEALAAHFYSEAMLRHLVKSTHSHSKELIKTGFSKLLTSASVHDATTLAEGLELFENHSLLQSLLQKCSSSGHLNCWVGQALQGYSVIAAPYSIHKTVVGAIAILGPHRIPYRKLFGLLLGAADAMTDSLTKSLYKFKISRLHDLLLENKS